MNIRKIAKNIVSLYYGKENLDMDKVMLLDHMPKGSEEKDAGKIVNLSARVSTLIIQAVKMSGLDLDSNMAFIGEYLTSDEYDSVKAFLKWCIDKNKRFGHGNIKQVWKEFKKDMDDYFKY